MNNNFAKLVALVIVGSVAKALFADPDTHVHQEIHTSDASSD